MSSWPFVWRWLFGIGWIVLPMLSLNLYDVSIRNPRPPGYFAYWMIPLFDILFFPLFFAVSLGIAGSFELGDSRERIAQFVGIVSAVIYVLWFWNMENKQLAIDPSKENWTVNINGHNRYAYAHAVLMFVVVWYTVSFFIRYGMLATVVATPWVWVQFVVVLAVLTTCTTAAFAFPGEVTQRGFVKLVGKAD